MKSERVRIYLDKITVDLIDNLELPPLECWVEIEDRDQKIWHLIWRYKSKNM